MSPSKTLKSFGYAWNGIIEGLKGNNIRAHILVGLIVILVGILFRLNHSEWIAIILSIAGVLTSELLNTAIEETCNVLRDHLGASYDSTKIPRDIGAGAVLIMCAATAITGIIIFLPKLLAI